MYTRAAIDKRGFQSLGLKRTTKGKDEGADSRQPELLLCAQGRWDLKCPFLHSLLGPHGVPKDLWDHRPRALKETVTSKVEKPPHYPIRNTLDIWVRHICSLNYSLISFCSDSSFLRSPRVCPKPTAWQVFWALFPGPHWVGCQ